jgi:type IV secretion system protein VirD4
VRVSFATNDERTAKRVIGRPRYRDRDEGDAELCRASAQPLARPSDGLALGDGAAAPHPRRGHAAARHRRDRHGGGCHPIRAKKARYYEDRGFKERILPPPDPTNRRRSTRKDSWSELKPQRPDAVLAAELDNVEDAANGGLRREPELPDHVAIAKETTGPAAADEFSIMLDDEPEDAARQRQVLRQQMRGVARQVALDPNDGIDL